MKYFTLGPVEMDCETLEISRNPLPYFRDEEFSAINLTVVDLLKKFLNTHESTRLAMLTASGTAAMEAAVAQTFTRDDFLFIINGGGFGQRFVDICNAYKIPYKSVEISPDQPLSQEFLDGYIDKSITGVLLNIHETTTGRLYPIEVISYFAKACGAILVVDAISSFMADSFFMDDWGIDITIFSSHKSLSVAPGLSFVAVNDKVFKNRYYRKTPQAFYLNLNSHFDNIERGQTPYTPAVSVIVQLHDKLCRIDGQGLESFLRKIDSLASGFRSMLIADCVVIPEYPLSNAMTPLLFPDGNAAVVYKKLRDQYNIVVNPSGGEWQDKMLRVGHMGNLDMDDFQVLSNAMRDILLTA